MLPFLYVAEDDNKLCSKSYPKHGEGVSGWRFKVRTRPLPLHGAGAYQSGWRQESSECSGINPEIAVVLHINEF